MENQGQKVAELLEQYGLFWNVSKQPLSVVSEGLDVIHTDFYGVMREDTQKVFTSVKQGYEVYQNWELIELLQKVANETDLKISNGGSFKGGAKIYLQMDSGVAKGIGINNDTIKKYITAINSHDGSTSLTWGQSNLTISCSNTFHQASRNLANKVRHTSNMRYKVEDALRQIDAIRVEEKTLFETFFKLAEVDVKQKDVVNVIQNVTGVDVNNKVSVANDVYSTRQVNKAEQLSARIFEEMNQKGHTLWGLFSGVTSYTTKDVKPNADDTLLGKFLGTIGKADNKVLTMLSKQVA